MRDNINNLQQVLFTPYYTRTYRGRTEGSKAEMQCMNGWKIKQGDTGIQECVLVNGELKWTEASVCVYSKSCSACVHLQNLITRKCIYVYTHPERI